jgi:hypothetical protein
VWGSWLGEMQIMESSHSYLVTEVQIEIPVKPNATKSHHTSCSQPQTRIDK